MVACLVLHNPISYFVMTNRGAGLIKFGTINCLMVWTESFLLRNDHIQVIVVHKGRSQIFSLVEVSRLCKLVSCQLFVSSVPQFCVGLRNITSDPFNTITKAKHVSM